jgi:isoleucyl-tRNA synthetase
MPFLTEAIWRNLRCRESDHDSVHCSDWPTSRQLSEDERKLISEMERALAIINEGRGLRQELGIKIRQPLRSFQVPREWLPVGRFEGLVLAELNVKSLTEGSELGFDTELDEALLAEGAARELIHAVQGLRKKSGFEVSDRIRLYLGVEDGRLASWLRSRQEHILAEVLGQECLWQEPEQPGKELRLNGSVARVAVEKV